MVTPGVDWQHGTPAGILILGAPRAGDELEAFLVRNGLARPVPPEARAQLASCNERLVREGGGTPLTPIAVAEDELASRLGSLRGEARQLLTNAVASAEPGALPWVWWHPLTAFLHRFWVDIAEGDVAILHAVGPPGPSIGALAEMLETSAARAEHFWTGLQRTALAAFDHPRSMLMGTGAFDEPKALATDLARFLDLHSPPPEELSSASRHDRTGEATIDLAPTTVVLWTFLDRLSRQGDDGAATPDGELIDALRSFYDEAYFDTYGGGEAYRRGVDTWERFFNAVSERIEATIRPRTVLDAGCAIGLLVEGLRRVGVDASGFDISPFAISQAPTSLAPYLSVRSITDEIEGQYDLITCLEVVQHLPHHLADHAIANVCRHADIVLFSSSPVDLDEPSNINVHPTGWWAQRFADQGFHRDFSYDASYVAPHAVLFRRRGLTVEQAIAGYERQLWHNSLEYQRRIAAAAEEARAARYLEAEARQDQARRQHALMQLEQRRTAETAATAEAFEEQTRNQTLLSNVAERAQAEAEAWRREVEKIHQTKIFRYSHGLRRLYGRLRRHGPTAGPASAVPIEASPDLTGGSYALWVATYDTLSDQERDALRQQTAGLANAPVFSVLLPVYNTSERYLRAAIDSVRNQLYPHWQLCVADDCSTDQRIRAILGEYEAADERISVVYRTENGHISAASNSALEIATGGWVVLLDHDDELTEHALAVMAMTIADHPEVSYLYSDEDKLDAQGQRFSAFFKPEFDPLMLLGENYPCHLFVARRELVEQVGGFRVGFEGSQDWDLVLRVTERLEPGAIHHVPHVLYHWRVHPESTAASGSAKPYAAVAGLRAVEEHLARTGQHGEVTWNPATGRNRVRWELAEHRPLVSIIIPTRDGPTLTRCIDSLRRQTTYDPYEILVVDNGSHQAQTLDFLRAYEGTITVIRDDRPFNYSALNNAAAEQARGELLLLLNDDIEVMGGDWLEEMVTQIMRPNVGVVGAKLNYPNGIIQHAGVTLGIHGVAGHIHRGVDRFDLGYFGDLALTHHVSAVTGACMLVRRDLWTDLGGLDAEELPVAFNDVDFCLRAREAGWAVIWTPFAELIHYESITRGHEDTGARADSFSREVETMKRRWAHVLRDDPAYNPNLSLLSEHADLAWPPRVSYVRGAR